MHFSRHPFPSATKSHFFATLSYILAVLYCHFAVLHPFLPLRPPKHRLRCRNFSLLLCKITLKMHKNKKFCIGHFTFFEQNCYKSCNNIKLYLCFLQIILYIYSRFCKIMPYYSHPLYRPDSPPLCAHPHIRAHAHILIRIAHTQLHVYTHAFNIYKGFWLSFLARIYKYGYWRCKR